MDSPFHGLTFSEMPESGDVSESTVEPLTFRMLSNVSNSCRVETDSLPAVAENDSLQDLCERITLLEQQLKKESEEHDLKIAQSLQLGREEGELAKAQEMGKLFNEEHKRVEILLQSMESTKREYFQRVEKEVVRLALAIAARILHREAQIDPLLLSGVVRVAMERLADTSSAVLKVPSDLVDQWTELFHSVGKAQLRPTIIGDKDLQPSDCILETQLGVVEFGVKAQLEEIERGFFDLLQHKPQAI